MTEYKAYGIVGGKPKWTIVDESGKTINEDPRKEELKHLEIYDDGRRNQRKKYNETNTCDRCSKIFDIVNEYPRREYDKEGNWTRRWICKNCYLKDYSKNNPSSQNNIIKQMRPCRTGNQYPNSNNTIGYKTQKLINILENFEDLNKKYDNYKSPIDSIDPNTGLKYQIRGRLYDSRYGFWSFSNLEIDWDKEYHSIFCVCKNKDRTIIERIYKIPELQIKYKRKGISIYKNPSRGVPWYEQYRVKDEEYIKKANEIWKKIIEEE